MLDVRRLQVLLELDARGSFSAAADALHLAQSAVSQHVRASSLPASGKNGCSKPC
jgi:DNA-binding transcriptional LysR family regulator